MLLSLFSILYLAGLGFSFSPASYNCTQLTIPVDITAQVTNLNFPAPANQTEVTTLFTNLASVGYNVSALKNGQTTLEGTQYDIWSLLCLPAGFAPGGTLEFAVHGVNFDHSYWNFGGEGSQYNYVEAALRSGHAVFVYDRLGTGLSSKPDGIQEVQTLSEIAIAEALIEHLRGGQAGFKPGKIIGIGHSLGSIQLAGLVAQKGDALDALVLTGFSTDPSGMPAALAAFGFTIAAQQNQTRFGSLGPEYIVSGGPSNDQMNFFAAPNYENWVFNLAVQTKETATIGEFLTIGDASKPADQFQGPVLVVTGNHDFIFCRGLCRRADGTDVVEGTKALFPSAGEFEVYVPDGTGHAVNLHLGAEKTFDVMQEWIGKRFGS